MSEKSTNYPELGLGFSVLKYSLVTFVDRVLYNSAVYVQYTLYSHLTVWIGPVVTISISDQQ